MTRRIVRHGSGLITCTIVLVVISARAVGLAGISRANLETAHHQQQANRAFASLSELSNLYPTGANRPAKNRAATASPYRGRERHSI